MPGVTHAALSSNAPLRSAQAATIATTSGGAPVLVGGRGASYVNYVSDGFIEAAGMHIVAGRSFSAADRTGPRVMIVNQTLANLAWPGRSPIGECAYRGDDMRECVRVIGVVRNATTFRLREDAAEWPWLYEPLSPADIDHPVLMLRVEPGVPGIEATVRRTLREVDAAIPYVDVPRLGDVLDPQVRPWRLGATVFTAFGMLAALIAAVGLHAAVAYAVTQRTREIGVRIALGALRQSILRLVLGDGLRIATTGVAFGVVTSLVCARWIGPLLFDTSPRDPRVLVGVAALLVIVALLSTLAPARRAVRVDPMQALRSE